ncbi:MAG TPA: hypothetical protein VFK78_11995 [Gemmatimonadales bacterium]|nr:hypothetical protein [Gemmatimonadales bacterium]
MIIRGAGPAVATIVAAAWLGACGGRKDHAKEAKPVTASRSIEAVLAAHTGSLMAVPGVVGTAIGRCDGTPCIRVLLAAESDAARRRIPPTLEGYPVRVDVTGPFRAR